MQYSCPVLQLTQKIKKTWAVQILQKSAQVEDIPIREGSREGEACLIVGSHNRAIGGEDLS